MEVDSLDHLVLTVKNLETTLKFYTEVLGMKKEIFGENRIALKFGNQKINLHELGNEYEPKAKKPTPGSADLCFITKEKLENVIEHINRLGIRIIEGPITRTGANGKIKSIYIRDPDENLIEISNY
jgi:catechol 2,3-dioxygenase-like lactoylglutathione lyase family enzyme